MMNVFCYGALMFPEGINGRGMKYKYDWKDFTPARLKGFERSLCAVVGNVAYYGVRPKSGSEVNGVLITVHSRDDLRALLMDEGVLTNFHPYFPMYENVGVTEDVEPKINNLRTIVLAVPDYRKIPKNVKPNEGYVHYVWEGIQRWGKDFTDEFLRTGGQRLKKVTISARLYGRRRETWKIIKSLYRRIWL
jgi:hypothetical protein